MTRVESVGIAENVAGGWDHIVSTLSNKQRFGVFSSVTEEITLEVEEMMWPCPRAVIEKGRGESPGDREG